MSLDTITNINEHVMWSADVRSIEEVTRTLEAFPATVRPKIDRLGQKIMGADVVARLSAMGIEVFDDSKIIEIPEKMEGLAEEHCKAHPWMLNCMAGGVSTAIFDAAEEKKHRDGLKRFADVCRSHGVLPCGVTVLTSKTDDEDEPEKSVVRQEFNGRTSIEQAMVYVEWLIEAGFTDFVCSIKEIASMAEAGLLEKINANVPAIRLPGGETHDQARVGTPRGALLAGAKRLVIGRALTDDPVNNYRRIEANIRGE